MKVRLNLAAFNAALGYALKGSKQFGDWILISATNSGISIASRDDADTVRSRVEGEIFAEGTWMPNGATLRNVVSTLARQKNKQLDTTIDITTEGDQGSVVVGNIEMQLNGGDPNSYPQTPPPVGTPHSIDPATIISGIDQVVTAAGAAAVDDMLRGICFRSVEGTLHAMSTDGRQAASAVISPIGEDWADIILGRAESVLLSSLAKGQDDLKVWVGQGRLWAKTGPHNLTCSTVMGNFPDLLKVLPGPEYYDTRIKVDLEEWNNAIALVHSANSSDSDVVAQLVLGPEDSYLQLSNQDGHFRNVTVPLPDNIESEYKAHMPMSRLQDRLRHAGPDPVLCIPTDRASIRMPLRVENTGYVAWVMGLAR